MDQNCIIEKHIISKCCLKLNSTCRFRGDVNISRPKHMLAVCKSIFSQDSNNNGVYPFRRLIIFSFKVCQIDVQLFSTNQIQVVVYNVSETNAFF